MDLYDLFVLAVAAVVFYWIFRIVAKVYRGAKAVANTAKKVTNHFQGKKEAKNPAPSAAQAAAPAGEQQELKPMSEAAAIICEKDKVADFFAALICNENNALLEYMHNNCDCSKMNDSHKILFALCFVVNLVDRLKIGNDPCALKAIFSKLIERDSDYKYALDFAWNTGTWKLYMEYKPGEKKAGEAVSMVFIRTLSSVVPRKDDDHLFAYVGRALRHFDDEVDDVWNA